MLGAVRPENVALARQEPHALANRLRVRVAASVMLGDTMEFVLNLADGRDFVSRVPRHGAELYPQGAELWAFWEPDFFSLFPFEDLQAGPAEAAGAAEGI